MRWQSTGIFPFPTLGVYPAPMPHLYVYEDLGLIYHVASLYHELASIDANNLTLWTRHIPTYVEPLAHPCYPHLHVPAALCDAARVILATKLPFPLADHLLPISLLRIGATTPYVMHALLAFSAMHIVHLTDSPRVGSMAFEHRGVALSGLHEAIGSFSRETSDAILAASLVLSWQATDW